MTNIKPKFDTDFEYDEWFEVQRRQELLEDYWGNELKKEGENGN